MTGSRAGGTGIIGRDVYHPDDFMRRELAICLAAYYLK